MSEFHTDIDYAGSSQVEQSMETRQTDVYNKDVVETGRWGGRTRKEIILVALFILAIIAATATTVVLTMADESDEQFGETKKDPASGKTISAYELPTFQGTQVDDNAEFSTIQTALKANAPTSSIVIPGNLKGLHEDNAADPILRAASWLTTVDTTNTAEVAVTRFALASIYYNNLGHQWIDNTNWMSEKSHCEWKGVVCCSQVPSYLSCSKTDGQDLVKVVELDLSSNQLYGSIPAGVSLLKDLEALIFTKNYLMGTIPKDVIHGLPKINQIYLSHNKLSGTIPEGLDSDSLGK
jgi:hypothetical protein